MRNLLIPILTLTLFGQFCTIEHRVTWLITPSELEKVGVILKGEQNDRTAGNSLESDKAEFRKTSRF